MRTSSPRIVLALATGGLVTLYVALAQSAAQDPQQPQVELVDPADAAAASVRRTGDAAINWLGTRLIREVASAVDHHDPSVAISACHLTTLPATGAPIPSMPSITAVKRTSLRLNNPANAPDAADQFALDHALAAFNRGAAPRESFVVRVTTADAGHEWRVYRALGVLPSCVACHGDARTRKPALVAEIQQRYPEAAAVDYRVGDWRGLIRVTVSPPPSTQKK